MVVPFSACVIEVMSIAWSLSPHLSAAPGNPLGHLLTLVITIQSVLRGRTSTGKLCRPSNLHEAEKLRNRNVTDPSRQF